MTLYQVIQKINDSLGARDNEVFNHLIWGTTDNGNFLRTQYCKRHSALQDKELGYVKYAVLGMQQEYSTNDFVFNQDNTNAKIQIFWCNSASKAKEVVEINSNLGYTYSITIGALKTMDIYSFPASDVQDASEESEREDKEE